MRLLHGVGLRGSVEQKQNGSALAALPQDSPRRRSWRTTGYRLTLAGLSSRGLSHGVAIVTNPITVEGRANSKKNGAST